MTLTTITNLLQKAGLKYSQQPLGSFLVPETGSGSKSLEEIILEELPMIDEVKYVTSGTYGQYKKLTIIARTGRVSRETRKRTGSITMQVDVEFRFKMFADKTWQVNVDLVM